MNTQIIKINKTFEELDSCRETIKILEEYISNKDTVIRTLKGVITLQEIRAVAWQRKEAEYMESVSIRDEKIKDLSGLAKSLKWKNAKNKIAFYTIVPALSLSLIILPILLKR
jgi:GMP synthase PP-ATPase subunit